jgi:hypothetical protein
MRTVVGLAVTLLLGAPVLAEDRLTSPYRQQAAAGLRGLSDSETSELRAGAGMGLARAAELNGYPGPRHVLDAVAAGKLRASAEQVQRVQKVFDEMKREAQRIGARILEEERQLEAGFSAATMTGDELRSRVARIAALQGELRTIHLSAHLATRAILSDTQVARYNELRGYTEGAGEHQHMQHQH